MSSHEEGMTESQGPPCLCHRSVAEKRHHNQGIKVTLRNLLTFQEVQSVVVLVESMVAAAGTGGVVESHVLVC